MLNLVKNEIIKICKQKKLYIFMGIILFLVVLQFVKFHVLKLTNYQGKWPFENVNGQTFPIMMLGGISTILVIYITLLLADIVTDEYKNGTLKQSLLRPVSRIKLLVSKVIGLFLAILLLNFFTMLLCYVSGTLFFGWGDEFTYYAYKIGESGDITNVTYSFTTLNGILFTVFSYILMTLPFFAFGMIVFFISLQYTNMGATIGTALGLWFVSNLATRLIKQVRPFLMDSYYTFYMEFTKDINWPRILWGFAVITIYSTIFFLAGVTVFRKKDILL